MMRKVKSFRMFIREYLGQSSPRSDLAEDILRDLDFPNTNRCEDIIYYMATKAICDGAKVALYECMSDYVLDQKHNKLIKKFDRMAKEGRIIMDNLGIK